MSGDSRTADARNMAYVDGGNCGGGHWLRNEEAGHRESRGTFVVASTSVGGVAKLSRRMEGVGSRSYQPPKIAEASS
jgi:hypothetical protein